MTLSRCFIVDVLNLWYIYHVILCTVELTSPRWPLLGWISSLYKLRSTVFYYIVERATWLDMDSGVYLYPNKLIYKVCMLWKTDTVQTVPGTCWITMDRESYPYLLNVRYHGALGLSVQCEKSIHKYPYTASQIQWFLKIMFYYYLLQKWTSPHWIVNILEDNEQLVLLTNLFPSET